jgi:hypothetical protein
MALDEFFDPAKKKKFIFSEAAGLEGLLIDVFRRNNPHRIQPIGKSTSLGGLKGHGSQMGKATYKIVSPKVNLNVG